MRNIQLMFKKSKIRTLYTGLLVTWKYSKSTWGTIMQPLKWRQKDFNDIGKSLKMWYTKTRYIQLKELCCPVLQPLTVTTMWLDGFEMCCQYKIYTGFRKHSMNKEMESISFINKTCKVSITCWQVILLNFIGIK